MDQKNQQRSPIVPQRKPRRRIRAYPLTVWRRKERVELPVARPDERPLPPAGAMRLAA